MRVLRRFPTHAVPDVPAPGGAVAPTDRRARRFVSPIIGPLLVPHLPRLLSAPVDYRPLPLPLPPDCTAVIGWGFKGKALEAVALAERAGLPYLALEDGFLRSVALGDIDAPLSVVVDDLGIYYDAQRPSRLERLIATAKADAERARGARIAAAWRAGRLSKYNHAREVPPPVRGDFVLAVDQTFGDASIERGLASPASFARMLEAALDEHPRLPVVLKVHPDVIAGRKRAHFGALSPATAARVTLLAGDAHPPALLERAAAVYVVTSQMGFEALVWGRPVRAFGMPFYAGWGLTGDELSRPERRAGTAPTLDDLVHAALVEYPRYLDPETFERCEPERVIEWMALQRRLRERFPPVVQAVGFSQWKRPFARAFFAGSELRFVDDIPSADAPPAARAMWGRPADDAARGRPDVPLLRVEDGFLRSVGLGANLVQPLSWVIDRQGMYYDATGPSDLEGLLQQHVFDGALLARAGALRQSIVARGITKYNVGRGEWRRPAQASRVLLVPGQVEDDASIRYGSRGLQRNLDLLRAVREANPEAYVVYKPHPDVLARKRPDGTAIEEARRWCDEIVTDVPIQALFGAVDALHVLTSLAGFEALLRGVPVTCHGLPFYAGWGLTDDRVACPRRTRRLQLDELVAGALIVYPVYVSRASGAFTTPERALHELLHWAESVPPALPRWLAAASMLKRWRDRARRRLSR
jgi:capsular polysaccharide export protein